MSQMVRSSKGMPPNTAPTTEANAKSSPSAPQPSTGQAATTTPESIASIPQTNTPTASTAAPLAAEPIPAPRPKVAPPKPEEPAESAEFAEFNLDTLLDKAAEAVQKDLGDAPKIQPPTPPPPAETPLDIYKRLMLVSQAIFEGVTWNSALDGNLIIAALKSAHQQLQAGDDILVELIRYRGESHSWAIRGANTALITMCLGREFKYDEKRCLGVGLCSMMHDLGMLKIPEDLLASSKEITPAQIALLHNHPLESQKMIENFDASFAWIGDVVVQVHERLDGSGYPLGLKGEKIHEFAQIIGLADSYEAMTFPRPDRKAKVAYAALKELLTKGHHLFDRHLIKSLVDIVSMFPLGSLVKLNNNEIGRVVRTSRQHPTRPILEILLDARGRLVEGGRTLDLVAEPMVYVMDPAIEEKVVQKAIENQAAPN